MSFKQKRKSLIVKALQYPEVQPNAGVNTLVWWRKGNEVDGFYFKADLYNTYGELCDSGFLGDTLEGLVNHVKDYYGLS